MRSLGVLLSRVHFLRVLSLVSVSLLIGAPVSAQTDRKEVVRIDTRDGVELLGHYYPGRGRSAPCVMMVHEWGKNSRVGPWKDFARTLNEKGYAVLTFDLRGHGYSTTVDETRFWLPMFHNRTFVRSRDAEAIDYRDFDIRYQQYLVNDLAAARAFLERRSNVGECNASNIVVIAAGSGATIASLWINAEWHRHELVPPPFPTMPARLAPESEGSGILGAILVSPEQKLGGRKVNLAAMLDLAGRRGKMPIAILHGDTDEEAQRLAEGLSRSLQTDRELTFTGAVAVAGARGLTGANLLHARYGMPGKIIDWIETLREKHSNEWNKREPRETLFVWKSPTNFNVWSPANQPGDRDLFIDSYQRFVR